MKTVQKAALSLLITVVVFGGFSVLAFSGLFSVIETKFYNQRVSNSLQEELHRTTAFVDDYHDKYLKRFDAVLGQGFIQRSFLPNLSTEDINEREKLFQYLQEELSGFLFVRFLDENGNIHYSTLGSDIKSQTDYSLTYKRLEDVENVVDPDAFMLGKGQDGAIRIDGVNNHIVFLFPFYDSLSIFKGTAVFYVSGKDFTSYLLQQGALITGQTVDIVDERGYLIHSGLDINEEVITQIRETWSRGTKIAEQKSLLQSDSGNTFALLSSKSENYFYVVGRLLPDNVFTLNNYLKIILMASFFITLFLLLFLILSLRQDKVLILSERIKRFQVNFLKEYVENKESIDWEKWKRELGARRELVKKEIKRGIGKFKGAKEETVDSLIEKSWDEIIEVIGSKISAGPSKINIDNLEEALERVLKSGTALNVQYSPGGGLPIPAPQPAPAPAPAPKEESFTSGMQPVDVEDIDEGEDIETLDEAEEIEEAEELGEVEELAEVEEIEAVEEPAEAEELAEVEEIEEAEELGEVEEIEEIEEIEEAEEPAEAGRTEEAAQLEEIDDQAEAEDVEDIQFSEEEYEEVSPEEEGVPGEPETEVEPEPAEDFEEIEEIEEPTPDEIEEVEEVPEEEPEEIEEINEEEDLVELEEPDEIPLTPLHIVKGEETAAEHIEELAEAEADGEVAEVVLDKVSGGSFYGSLFQSGFGADYTGNFKKIEASAAEELEEPEELEEMVDQNGVLQNTGNTDLDYLLEKNIISILPAAEVYGLIPEAAAAVIEEKDGIFTISENIISEGREEGLNRDFKKLTDDVLGVEKKKKEDTSTIEDLFSFSDVDLSLDLSIHHEDTAGSEEKDDHGSTGGKKTLHAAFTEEGLNIDILFEIMEKSNIPPIKGLMRLSKAVDAVYLGVLVYDNGAFKPDITIGLDSESIQSFSYFVNEEIVRYVMEEKNYLYGKNKSIELPAFKPKLSENDKRHLQNYLFIPGVYKNIDGMLFFGFKNGVQSIQIFINKLFSSDFLSV